jgi:hypothetical protein
MYSWQKQPLISNDNQPIYLMYSNSAVFTQIATFLVLYLKVSSPTGIPNVEQQGQHCQSNLTYSTVMSGNSRNIETWAVAGNEKRTYLDTI